MKKIKAQKIQKIRKARIQKITFISMAILMGILQCLNTNSYEYKVSLGHVNLTIAFEYLMK